MSTRISAGVNDCPCFIIMIPIDCKMFLFTYCLRLNSVQALKIYNNNYAMKNNKWPFACL